MRIGSLCMGIGGLDLAAEAVYGGSLAWCAEWEDAPSSVIERHWPGTPNYRDLTLIDWAEVEPIDVLTAGYPCQPFSHAGKRKGTNDVRHLWPHIAEAVRVLRPRRVVLENVAGHLTLGFGDVLRDLAEAGFDAEWCVLRASDVGACHQRARLFVVAGDADRARADARPAPGGSRDRTGESGGVAPHAGGSGAGRDARAVPGTPEGSRRPGERVHAAGDACADPADPDGPGREGEIAGLPHRGRCAPGRGGAAAYADHLREHWTRGARHGWGQPSDDRVAAPDTHRGRLEVGPEFDGEPLEAAADRLARGGHPHGLGDPARFGVYAGVIARHERCFGRRAPDPRDEKGRLAVPFVEWMQGYPEHWTGELGRTAALKAYGNSVCPQQGTVAVDTLEAVLSARLEPAYVAGRTGVYVEGSDG